MTTIAAPPNTDLVVVLPGIMGSTLGQTTAAKSAKHNLVWAVTGRAALHGVRNFLGHAPRSRSGSSTSSNFDVFAHRLPSLYQLLLNTTASRLDPVDLEPLPLAADYGLGQVVGVAYGALSGQTVSPFETIAGSEPGGPNG
jgi:hypothetical protein